MISMRFVQCLIVSSPNRKFVASPLRNERSTDAQLDANPVVPRRSNGLLNQIGREVMKIWRFWKNSSSRVFESGRINDRWYERILVFRLTLVTKNADYSRKFLANLTKSKNSRPLTTQYTPTWISVLFYLKWRVDQSRYIWLRNIETMKPRRRQD